MAVRPEQGELPIIQAHYDLCLWLIPAIGKYPRDHRFTLGERTENRLLTILERLLRAKFNDDRDAQLEKANLELELLRFELRLAKDLRCLSIKQYGRAAEALVSLGKQVGGWKKPRAR